ncbi:MAG: hypothetical protein HY591_04535 [Candidatus Omnitrophica bacterium]|nr:hypothetical protein [Candidatus Omnitrophota bacterium]
MVKVGPNFSRIRKNFETHISKWSAVIEKTVDLFMRVNTDQAEIIATVLFATKELTQRKGLPSELDVLESVMEWKQKPLTTSSIQLITWRSWVQNKPFYAEHFY